MQHSHAPTFIYLLSYLIITLILNTQKHMKTHVGVSAQKEMQRNPKKTKKEAKMLKQRNKQVFHTGKEYSVNSFFNLVYIYILI